MLQILYIILKIAYDLHICKSDCCTVNTVLAASGQWLCIPTHYFVL